MGALGATTLLFSKGRFVMPNTNIMFDPLKKEPSIYELLVKKLEPVEGDVIIIGSDDINRQTAELAAKNAALLTLINHKKHTKWTWIHNYNKIGLLSNIKIECEVDDPKLLIVNVIKIYWKALQRNNREDC